MVNGRSVGIGLSACRIKVGIDDLSSIRDMLNTFSNLAVLEFICRVNIDMRNCSTAYLRVLMTTRNDLHHFLYQ